MNRPPVARVTAGIMREGEEVLPVKIRELYHHEVLTVHADEEGRLVGIVTERDLVRAASDGADPLTT